MISVSSDFIAFIKDKFLSYKKPDKDLPALKELIEKVSLKDIFDEVESVFGKKAALGRNIKMFLCQRYTDKKLKDIGAYSGVGESIKLRSLGDMTRFSFIKSGSCPQTIEKTKSLKEKSQRLKKG